MQDQKNITRYFQVIDGYEYEFQLTINAIESIESKLDKGIYTLYDECSRLNLKINELKTVLLCSIIDRSKQSTDDFMNEFIRANYNDAHKLTLKLLITLFMPFEKVDTLSEKEPDKKKI